MQVFMLVGLVFAIIIAIFAVQNTQPVSVTFLTFQSAQLSLSIVVLVSAAIGAVLTFVLGIWRTVRSSIELKNGRKRIEEQDRTLQDLQQAQARAQEGLRQLQRENDQLKARLAERPAMPPSIAAGPAPTTPAPAPGPATTSEPKRPTSPQPST
jgi:lipopolysaccharide assembly protein A